MTTLFLPLALLAGLVISPAQQQPPKQNVFRAQSEIVLLDLIVRDKAGALVTDLHQKEVQVSEDGKKQKLNHFSFDVSKEPEPLQLGTVPAAPELGAPAFEPAVVILLDLSTMQSDGLERLKATVPEFLLSQYQGRGKVMVAAFRSGIEVIQPFTRDMNQVVQSFDQVKASPDDMAALGAIVQLARRVGDSTFATGNVVEQTSAAVREGKTFQATVENQVSAICGSISDLSRSLRAHSGRKSIVLYSTGYVMQPHQIARELIERRFGRTATGGELEQVRLLLGGLRGVNLMQYLDAAVDQANRSQVSVYGIDPRGLLAEGFEQDLSQFSMGGDSLRSFLREAMTQAPKQFLDFVSNQSGGQAFSGQNDLSLGLRQAITDSQSYYLLAYKPNTKRKKDKEHKIEIKIGRPDVAVLYRRSYIEKDEVEESQADLMAAIKSPGLFAGYPLELQTAVEGGQLSVTTLIPTDSLRFVKAGDFYSGSIEIFGFLFDQEGSWVGDNVFFSKGQNLRFNSERKSQLKDYANVTLTSSAASPSAGDYSLIVVVRQGVDGSISTIRQPLSVSD